MKKIAALLVGVSLAGTAFAQSTQLIAGFNFGQFLGTGPASLDPTTYDTVSSVNANFSETVLAPLLSGGDQQAAMGFIQNFGSGTGSVSWGSFTNVDPLSADILVVDQTAFSFNQTMPNGNLMTSGDGLKLGLSVNKNGGGIEFDINTAGFLDTVSGANLTFAAFGTTQPVSILWKIAGATVATTAVTGSGQNGILAYSVDLPTAFFTNGSSKIVAELSGTGGFVIDNVQFVGAVIPEPSTYAAILGALTLGFAGVRRRFFAKA